MAPQTVSTLLCVNLGEIFEDYEHIFYSTVTTHMYAFSVQ